MTDYPAMAAEPGRVEPCPRRVRAVKAGVTVVDTTEALYLWEWPNYPQFYVPEHSVRADLLSEATRAENAPGFVKIPWDAADQWFEENEEVFVHPRNPYTRVDALRSSRSVTVSLDGVVVAESDSPVLVFETGLPTRYYVDRSEVSWAHLEPSDTVTSCPYKGKTSSYWSIRTPKGRYDDLAWAYDFPTRQLLPIAGLVAFYNERVDLTIDGVLLPRPVTHLA